jgi:hypothetical protein
MKPAKRQRAVFGIYLNFLSLETVMAVLAPAIHANPQRESSREKRVSHNSSANQAAARRGWPRQARA